MTASNLTPTSATLKIAATPSNSVNCDLAQLSKVFLNTGKYPSVNNATGGMVLFVARYVLDGKLGRCSWEKIAKGRFVCLPLDMIAQTLAHFYQNTSTELDFRLG